MEKYIVVYSVFSFFLSVIFNPQSAKSKTKYTVAEHVLFSVMPWEYWVAVLSISPYILFVCFSSKHAPSWKCLTFAKFKVARSISIYWAKKAYVFFVCKGNSLDFHFIQVKTRSLWFIFAQLYHHVTMAQYTI